MGSPDESSELSLDQLVELERRAQEAELADADEFEHDEDADGGVVLPWWQHPVNIVTLVVTAALLAGMIGWMIGSSSSENAHNDVDTGFLQDMRVHHEQGVAMAATYLTRPDIDPGLATVAGSIIQGQTLEVGRMIQMLRYFGEAEAPDLQGTAMTWMNMGTTYDSMPGMATEEQLAELGAASGSEADELFVELMKIHHLGGIHMAEFAAENGQSDEVTAFAEGIITGQQSEIDELEGQLG